MKRIILLALLALLAACSKERGVVYPVTLDRARQVLLKAELPPVFGSAAVSGDARAYKQSEVTWIVRNNGDELMRFVATLSEAGQGKTRVLLDLKGSKPETEKRFAENVSIKNLYLVAMGERIASSIEGRPLDMTKITPALAIAALANMRNLHSSLDEAVRASEELERSHPRLAPRR